MKNLQEQVQKFRKLALLEATTAASSGSYEAPLEFEMERPQEDFIGLVVSDDAPKVDTVDITGGDVGGFEEIDIDADEEGEYQDEETEDGILTLMNTLGLGL
tara:strand:+ start:1969 stop:2274 length:306 start_codon:yes stop_codon:yes gene_type:complete